MWNFKLNDLAKAVHDNAKAKGFWDKPVEKGTYLMLITSELGEALEADRKGRKAELAMFNKRLQELNSSINTRIMTAVEVDNVKDANFKKGFELFIKDSHEDEIADAVIRSLDYSAHHNIDLDTHVALKMRYNSMRERLHGKTY